MEVNTIMEKTKRNVPKFKKLVKKILVNQLVLPATIATTLIVKKFLILGI